MKEDKNRGKSHYSFSDLVKAGLSIFTIPQFNTVKYKDPKSGSIISRIRGLFTDTSKVGEHFDTVVIKDAKRKWKGKTEEEIVEMLKRETQDGK